MSHFYGTIKGRAHRTVATRCGDKSGMTTHTAGWKGAIRVDVWHDEATGKDCFSVELVPWQNSGGQVLHIGGGELNAVRETVR